MKSLVVYFSRTGNTKKAGEEIASALKADVEEISEEKNRDGTIAWIKSGFEGMEKKPSEINEPKLNPEKYNIAVIGTPVWAGNMASPVRAYFHRHEGQFKKVAFFCTCGDSPNKTFVDMQELSVKPKATLAVPEKEIKDGSYKKKCAEFASQLK